MSRFRPRRTRRPPRTQAQEDAARWYADRYRPHNQYSASQLRSILIEDAVARWPTPLHWAIPAYDAIATAERTTSEAVFAQVRQACLERTGLDMPMAGLV